MTTTDLQEIRNLFDTWLAEAKLTLLPFNLAEYEQEVRRNPKHSAMYFDTHDLPENIKEGR